METSASRREAGTLIHRSRKKRGLSQRALAARAGISETWLRALTVGLRGEAPQRAADDTWIALAREVGLHREQVFEVLGRPLPEPDAEGGEGGERYVIERTTHQGRALEIVTDLEADAEDLPDEIAEEMVRRSVEHMAAQARLMMETERRRWERQQEQPET